MSLQSDFGNIISNIKNQLESALSAGLTGLGGIAQSAGTAVSNVWAGGFAGMKDPQEFITALKTYREQAQAAVAEYNASADLDTAFKGDVQAKLSEFVTSTKDLLDAWVQLVSQWEKEAMGAFETWDAEDSGTVSANVQNATEEVKQMASNIRLD